MQPKILFVDDEPDFQSLLQLKLNRIKRQKELNFELFFATNGVEALKALESESNVEVVLTDLNMPQMDGLTLLEKIQSSYPSVKTVILSAYEDIGNIRTSMNRGAFDFLPKPIDFEDLTTTIQRALHSVKQYKSHLKLLQEKELSLKQALEDQKRLTLAYEKFVPHEFLELLKRESILDIKLGDHVEKDMTVLFSDIRSFTALSEGMPIEENFKFLNSYFNRMAPIVEKNNGFVDKYIGDSIMALFDKGPDDAVCAANEMLEVLQDYNVTLKQAGYTPIKIGIGINTGRLMLGTLGAANRMESTVISDAVNVTSRIEQLTKIYGTSLLISNETFLKLREPWVYSARIIDNVKVRGKSHPILIYEIFDHDPPEIKELKLATRSDFEKGWFAYQSQSFEEAIQFFQECYEVNPADQTSKIYIERCQHIIDYAHIMPFSEPSYSIQP